MRGNNKRKFDDRHRKRGWTLPGYNYMGPGNSLDNGPPTSADDNVAMEHDHAYQKYLDAGQDPYWNYNQADEDAVKKWGNSLGGMGAKAVFKTKKFLANHHVLGHIANPGVKRTAGQDPSPKKVAKKEEPNAPAKPNGGVRASPNQGNLRKKQEEESKSQSLKDSISQKDSKMTKPDHDMGQSPAVNLQSSGAQRGATMTRNKMGDETTVDPVRYEKLHPFPDTTNAIMPFRHNATTSLTPTNDTAGQSAISFRLNSINDIITNSTYTSDPTPAADTTYDGSSFLSPMMYNYWKNIYRYWTVTKATYHIKWWCKTLNSDSEWSLWTYHHGQQAPPLLDGTATIKDYVRKMHKHCHSTTLVPLGASNDRNVNTAAVHVSGLYEPGNYTVHNAVWEDEFSETWHKWNEIPSKREIVTFIFNKSDNASTSATTHNFEYTINVTYHVQLKDLQRIFEYPMASDDIAAVTDYMALATSTAQ